MNVTKRIFGEIENQITHAFILDNGLGMQVEILELGAIVRAINVPDQHGNIADVTLGWDTLEEYIKDKTYLGATIGRVANRIGKAQFSINDSTHNLAPNALPDFGNNHLHGGVKGFNKAFWKGETFMNENEIGVKLKYTSVDGEEGYPGNVFCTVEYVLNRDNTLQIRYEATTDKTTLINLTHHSYFNLAGAGNGDILNHEVRINADQITPADEDLIPIGEIVAVKGSPFDFNEARSVKSRFDEMQFSKFKGYDINYVLNQPEKGEQNFAAMVYDPESGRKMEVYTTQPCMHFYTGNFLNGEIGKSDKAYNRYEALCFEPQGYPDAPNHKNFQHIVLHPDNVYRQNINYRFSIEPN